MMKCRIEDLGLVDYAQAHQLQLKTVEDVLRGGDNRLFLCQHPPTFTLGRIAREGFFLKNPQEIRAQGMAVVRVDRGGEVTFHGPGQWVAYPIFDLARTRKDLKVFLQKLEEVVIDLLKNFGIVANRQKGYTGVWVGEKKIASVGIGVKKWVTYHGLAVNVTTDLKFFSMIKPCGLDVAMTSLAAELKRPVDDQLVKDQLIRSFERVFELEIPA